MFCLYGAMRYRNCFPGAPLGAAAATVASVVLLILVLVTLLDLRLHIGQLWPGVMSMAGYIQGPFYLHYVRFRYNDDENITLSFLDYLSVQSAVQRLKPDRILLHAEVEPTGAYWDRLVANKWITYSHRAKPGPLGGRIKDLDNPYHMTDLIKLDVLLEYGGLAVDFDIYFVRGERIKRMLRHQAAVTCYGDEIGYCIGLIGFKRESRLLRALRRSYDVIYTTEWMFNSGDVLKYLSELYADETYVVDKVCNNPHANDLWPLFRSNDLKWTDSVAIHTYDRANPDPEIMSPSDLLTGSPSSYKSILLTIHENRALPEEDPTFVDRIDPLKGLSLFNV